MVYIIYNVSNTQYQKELSDLLEYSIVRSGQEGQVIQLQNNDIENGLDFKSNIGITYKLRGVANKRNSLKFNHLTANDWISSSHLFDHHYFNEDDLLFFVDPDMIFTEKIKLDGIIQSGEVWGQDWLSFQPGPWYGFEIKNRAVMYPYLIKAGDYKKMIPTLDQIGTHLYNNYDDWMLDMYTYAITFEKVNFKSILETELCLCSSWSNRENGSPMAHYMMGMRSKFTGEIFWAKHSGLYDNEFTNPDECDNGFDRKVLQFIMEYKHKRAKGVNLYKK